MSINRYSFPDLASLCETDPSQENLKALWLWFTCFDPMSWNGIGYQIRESELLIPIYDSNYNLVSLEVRS